jgi:hypothetical protein
MHDWARLGTIWDCAWDSRQRARGERLEAHDPAILWHFLHFVTKKYFFLPLLGWFGGSRL